MLGLSKVTKGFFSGTKDKKDKKDPKDKKDLKDNLSVSAVDKTQLHSGG